MSKHNSPNLLTWLLFVVLIVISTFNIFLLISNGRVINDRLNDSQRDKILIESLEAVVDDKIIDEKAIRGIVEEYYANDDVDAQYDMESTSGEDGNDGEDGVPGVDGSNGRNGIDGKNGNDGKDGATPIIRCNQSLNRWEVRYSLDDVWETMNGEIVKCMIGVGNVYD